MKRIMVIGCCGAGKSTFSKQLHQLTGIELIHLDQAYWRPNWQEPSKVEWSKRVMELAAQPEWILDGNYGGTIDIRLEKADTIIFLDRSRWTCLYRVLKRTVLNYKRTRPDMTEGCRERFDYNFLKYVFHFQNKKRPGILKRLEDKQEQAAIYILKSEQEITSFWQKLK